MKVIGKSQDGYLIAATATEIAQLFGHYSANSDEYERIRAALAKGEQQ